MARRFSQFCVNILLLSMFLQTSEIRCLGRLSRIRLSSEADDIRSILSSTLDAKPSQIENNKKRETSIEDLASADSQAEDNVASESKDVSVYDEDVDEDYLDQSRDLENSELKRSVDSDSSAEKSENQLDADAYEDTDLHEVKDVAKRDANNEDDYNEDLNAEASVSSDSKVDEVKTRSTNPKSIENLEKKENQRSPNVDEVNSELEFEKQIEDQIQQRIDSIKEEIKRDIERKQQIREIEANNAKYDELEANREDDEVESQNNLDRMLDPSKRSISHDKDVSNEVEKLDQSVRSKRSDIEVNKDKVSESSKRSISRKANEVEKSGQAPELRSIRSDLNEVEKSGQAPELRSIRSGLKEVEKSGQAPELRSIRSDLNEVEKNKDNKESAMVLPVKKRSLERRMTLVEKKNLPGGKRQERSSILIPERGHAEVKDELPGDFTLGSNLRIARAETAKDNAGSRSARSVLQHEEQPKRFRRDMANEAENGEGTVQDSFLFAAGEKPECQTRRRRRRGRKKGQKHPRHSRRHRAVRESSMDDEEIDEERDKRAMSLDEGMALEYKESFGGLQADAGGALGRFKRIRRSSKIS